MIPCASRCPHYCEGCHKNCPEWKLYLKTLQEEQKAKRDWLREQNRLNTDMMRSFVAISACHSCY